MTETDREKALRVFITHHRKVADEFMAMVGRAKEYIAAGDIFQVVLAERFDCFLLSDSRKLEYWIAEQVAVDRLSKEFPNARFLGSPVRSFWA